jgi:hypothetical protein
MRVTRGGIAKTRYSSTTAHVRCGSLVRLRSEIACGMLEKYASKMDALFKLNVMCLTCALLPHVQFESVCLQGHSPRPSVDSRAPYTMRVALTRQVTLRCSETLACNPAS